MFFKRYVFSSHDKTASQTRHLISPDACLVVPSPSSHPFSQTQGRPKRDRRPAGGVFAPGWAPDPAPTARNDNARESEEGGEDGEDSRDADGDADDAASLDGVSDGEESEEDEEDSDEDSGKGPRGAGGGAGGVASAGDENSDLEDSGYAARPATPMETPTKIPPATSVPSPAEKLAARGAKKTSILNWWSAPRAMRSIVRTARTTCLLTKR